MRLDALLNTGNDVEIIKNIQEHLEEISAVYRALPDSYELRGLLAKLGGETIPEQLGIDNNLVLRSLNVAHHLRNRFTALKFLNEVVKINHVL
jgi:glycerol-1-phosphate dehydrogenase [NAD(P)+]